MMKYADLQLDSRLNDAILKQGYEAATPIQEQSIPHILAGKDIAGLAQTGTGKTAAFLIPLIERILKAETQPEHERAFKDWQSYQCILILVPTRELADQIHENIQKLTQGCGLKSYPLYGGTGYEKQKEALKSGLHFIVSTPGRLIDLYKEHFVDFKKVRAVVFDEADRMFDMGFKDDMKYILSRIERNRQFLVFSATLNFDVLNTAYQFGAEPVEINISRDQAKADNVKDALFHVGQDEKPSHLLSLLKKENPRQTIIFTNFKNNVDRIAQFLTDNGYPAAGLSSLMSQSQRIHVMAQFKAENNNNILVATDVAARGLDISDVDLVVNFELPQDSESYVHRIGRTGRAGKEGKAYSFASEKDVDALSRIEEYTKKKISIAYLEDHELIKDFKPIGAERFGDDRSFGKRKDNHKDSRSQRPQKSQRPYKDNREQKNEGREKSFKAQGQKSDKFADRPSKHQATPKSMDKKPFVKHESKKSNTKDLGLKSQNGVVANQSPTKRIYRTESKSGLGKKIKSFFKGLFKN